MLFFTKVFIETPFEFVTMVLEFELRFPLQAEMLTERMNIKGTSVRAFKRMIFTPKIVDAGLLNLCLI